MISSSSRSPVRRDSGEVYTDLYTNMTHNISFGDRTKHYRIERELTVKLDVTVFNESEQLHFSQLICNSDYCLFN